MSYPRVVLQRLVRGARVSKRPLSQNVWLWRAGLGGAHGFKSGDVSTPPRLMLLPGVLPFVQRQLYRAVSWTLDWTLIQRQSWHWAWVPCPGSGSCALTSASALLSPGAGAWASLWDLTRSLYLCQFLGRGLRSGWSLTGHL